MYRGIRRGTIGVEKMNDLAVLLHDQLLEYSGKLKIVEKEMIRKYKSGENYQKELDAANGLKEMQKATLSMMGDN